MLLILLIFSAPWSSAASPAYVISQPQLTSVCMNLLSYGGQPVRRVVSDRFFSEVARAESAFGRERRSSSSPITPARRLAEIRSDLRDPRVGKSLLFVRGAEGIAEVTGALRHESSLLDALVAREFPNIAAARSAHGQEILDASPPAGTDEFYHRDASARVPAGFNRLLDAISNQDEFDLLDLARAASYAPDDPNEGDVLLFDQFIYRAGLGPEYTYLGVVRLQSKRLLTRSSH